LQFFRRAEKRRILNKKKIVRVTAMVELLLLSNADPNLRAVKNERVQTALMFASYATNKIGVVTSLLERGADINFANAKGFTALMVAVKASERNIGVVSDLLAGGADVNAVSIYGDTALKLAKLPSGWGKRLLKKHGAIDSCSSEDEAEEPDDREFRRMDAKREAKRVAVGKNGAAGGMDSDEDCNDSDEVEESHHIDCFPLSW